jgi:hypothetical protein
LEMKKQQTNGKELEADRSLAHHFTGMFHNIQLNFHCWFFMMLLPNILH